MSWEASAWAKKTRGHRSHGSGRLLLVMADYHSHQGGCFPSQKMLADDCEMPIRTVQWCLKALEDSGFIKTLQKGNQYQPTYYDLCFDVFDVAVAQDYEPARSEPASLAPSSEPATSDIVNPQDEASEPASPRITNPHEPSIEPPDNMIYPEWFKPLTELKGFKKTSHERTISVIQEGCADAGVSESDVVEGFAVYYRDGGKVLHGWNDPVKALRNTLPIQIAKTRNGTNPRASPGLPANAVIPEDTKHGPDAYEQQEARRAAAPE